MQKDILELEFKSQSTSLRSSCPDSEPSLKEMTEGGLSLLQHGQSATLAEVVLNKGLVCHSP